MKKQVYHVLGIMSGTSLDGIDIAEIYFEIKNNNWSFTLGKCATIPYDEKWVTRLKNAISFTPEELDSLNNEYTLLLGTIINEFITSHDIQNLDAVCSHGHTILHQPQNGFTLQIGNLPSVAQYCNQNVVCNFRIQDVELGGQGAPLVPIGDKILFSEYDFCLNLGGFSNISLEFENKRIAFDISPVNTVLNFYANQLGFNFDNQGAISRSGLVNLDLLNKLNALEYYKTQFPKSLGFEFVKSIVLPLIESHTISTEDKMRTFTEHIAYQAWQALTNFNLLNKKMLITGGGAYNTFLIERLQHYVPELTIVIPDAKTLEYKEALIFGLLGVLKLRNEINVLSSVTGAKHNHCSGFIYSIDAS